MKNSPQKQTLKIRDTQKNVLHLHFKRGHALLPVK